MKKLIRILILIPLCGLLVLLGGFLALGLYYRNNFPVNTWINGVYCTGKTIEQVNEELAAGTELPEIILLDEQGQEWRLRAEDIGLLPDYTSALKAYLRAHSSVLWMNNMQEPVRETIADAELRWSDKLLEEAVDVTELAKQAAEEKKSGCRVVFGEDGYYLEDHNQSRLNLQKLVSYVQNCLSDGVTYIDLVKGGCYEAQEDSAEDISQRVLWSRLQDFFANSITYDMGAEQIPLTPGILSSFLAADEAHELRLDDSGEPVVDESRVAEWVRELAEQYDTCDTVREFASTRGDVISVKYVTYGTRLDADAETAYLMEALQEKRTEPVSHVPAYLQEGFVRGLDDIGNTYIEIDMTEQHMYYYENGELKLDTDVVTGNTGRRMGTPEGINFVYNKQRNRVLRGADYATPVKYWMPVKGGVGIHDADWRKKFGGEIYKKNGSHGCINTPPEIMAELYDMVEIGTPVVMFY